MPRNLRPLSPNGENFMIKFIVATIIALSISTVVMASGPQPVVTQPYGVITHNDSGTIASTNVFQSIWQFSPNSRGRAGCTVQNTGTNTQFVFIGPIASALTAKSVKLTAGQSFFCNAGGIVAQDQISITGTAGDTFYAGQQ